MAHGPIPNCRASLMEIPMAAAEEASLSALPSNLETDLGGS